MEHAAEQFGISGADKLWETKEYEKLLERIKDGTVWHFRLTANPTKCCRNAKGERGTVQAHTTQFYQKKWLLERGEKCGFYIKEDDFTVMKSCWQRFYKGTERKKPVTLLTVTYEGILTVTDAERFRRTLTDGMGRGKAFGMGMLTVVKAGDTEHE
jgi:CRISPR system Cascade subunit CasE